MLDDLGLEGEAGSSDQANASEISGSSGGGRLPVAQSAMLLLPVFTPRPH